MDKYAFSKFLNKSRAFGAYSQDFILKNNKVFRYLIWKNVSEIISVVVLRITSKAEVTKNKQDVNVIWTEKKMQIYHGKQKYILKMFTKFLLFILKNVKIIEGTPIRNTQYYNYILPLLIFLWYYIHKLINVSFREINSKSLNIVTLAHFLYHYQ